MTFLKSSLPRNNFFFKRLAIANFFLWLEIRATHAYPHWALQITEVLWVTLAWFWQVKPNSVAKNLEEEAGIAVMKQWNDSENETPRI